jgi:multiple antibiotic resistance protein
MPDLTLDPELFVKAAVTMAVILDPPGNIPVFLSLTRHHTPAERRRAALQGTLVAAAVILAFAVGGELILRLLGIGLPALKAAGGLLLLLIALELLRPFDDDGYSSPEAHDIGLVPLGTPLLAGPGAIATAMVYMRQSDSIGGDASVVAALLAALLVVYAALRFSDVLARIIKPNGVHVVSRVMGLLLAAIAVQLVASAVEQWVRDGVS